MKPISIQLYTVRELAQAGDPLAVLEKISKIGYKGVEGSGYGLTPAQFRDKVADLGMVVSSYFGPVPTPETVQEFIETAQGLGTKNTVSGFWIPDFETLDAIKQSADKINAVLPTIRKAGLSFSLHNHWFEYDLVEGKLAIEWFLESCPDVELELDIYWAANFGAHKPQDIVKKYKDRIRLLHVKDGPLVKGEPHQAVGQGKVDIDATIHAADAEKLEWLIVELDECGTDMMNAVEESYDYLVGRGLAAGNRPV